MNKRLVKNVRDAGIALLLTAAVGSAGYYGSEAYVNHVLDQSGLEYESVFDRWSPDSLLDRLR